MATESKTQTRKKSTETENLPFAVNLRKAIARREKELGRTLSLKEIGEAIGVTPQSVSYYKLGQTPPDAVRLYKLAKFLNVSGDFLIGLTDDPSPRSSAVDELGLSPEAVSHLAQLHKWGKKEGIPKASLYVTDRLLQEKYGGNFNIYIEWAEQKKIQYGHGNRYMPVPGGGINQLQEYLQEKGILCEDGSYDPAIISGVTRDDEYASYRAAAFKAMEEVVNKALDEYFDMMENGKQEEN